MQGRVITTYLIGILMLATTGTMARAQEPEPLPADSVVYVDGEMLVKDHIGIVPGELASDTTQVAVDPEKAMFAMTEEVEFNPDPMRAVWMSALFPGLGQVYNRRYWKLPIIVGGFMALGYGTNWNNEQYQDYSRAYRDLLDNDPSSNSYMNFFPPTIKEEDLDKSWLSSVMKNRKDYYRRNRDLCIICMVGVYLICMVDAYVDASLYHFDISPDLSMDIMPAVMIEPGIKRPKLGVNWGFTF